MYILNNEYYINTIKITLHISLIVIHVTTQHCLYAHIHTHTYTHIYIHKDVPTSFLIY